MYKFILSVLAVLFIPENIHSSTWTKTFGGNSNDEGYAVLTTPDTGYVVAGYTKSFGAGRADAWLFKVDKYGKMVWSHTFGGTADDYVYSMDKTFDGGYILTGYTESFADSGSDVWLIKTDASGDTLWTQTFDIHKKDYGYCVRQISDSGYIITGYTESSDYYVRNALLIKTDKEGDSLWVKNYRPIGNYAYGYSVCETPDSGYIVTGTTQTPPTGTEIWVIKTDEEGDSLWAKLFQGPYIEEGRCIQQTLDSNYIICGVFDRDGCLMKMDVNGDTLWMRRFDNMDYWNNKGYFVQQTQDSGYIIAGNACNIWLIKTDKEGNLEWDNTFGGTNYEHGRCVRETLDGGYIIAGATSSYGQGYSYDLWLIRTDPGFGIEDKSEIKMQNAKLEVHPNPAVSWTRITIPESHDEIINLTLYDMVGRIVQDFNLATNESNSISLNLKGISSGIYFIKAQSKNHTTTKKLTVIR